jgi:hypothetical protein
MGIALLLVNIITIYYAMETVIFQWAVQLCVVFKNACNSYFISGQANIPAPIKRNSIFHLALGLPTILFL